MKLLVTILAFSLSACGNSVRDKDRPGNDEEPNNAVNGQTQGPGNNSDTNNGMSPTNNSPNVITMNNGNNTHGPNSSNNTIPPTNNNSTNNNSTNNNTIPPPNNNNPPGCEWDATFFGQIGGTDPHGGGVPTPSQLTVDAGLDDVLAVVPTQPDDPLTPEDEGYLALVNSIPVSGAIVTATGPQALGNKRFWVEDANTAMQLFVPFELGPIRVGDEVAFDVFAVENFEGHPQIAEVSSFQLLSQGNPVPYRDVNTRAFTAADYGRIVRLGGRLGAPYDCGGTDCFAFTYAGGQTTFRSRSALAGEGRCVSFAGPLNSFPGPRQTVSAPSWQLDTVNFDWMWVE